MSRRNVSIDVYCGSLGVHICLECSKYETIVYGEGNKGLVKKEIGEKGSPRRRLYAGR